MEGRHKYGYRNIIGYIRKPINCFSRNSLRFCSGRPYLDKERDLRRGSPSQMRGHQRISLSWWIGSTGFPVIIFRSNAIFVHVIPGFGYSQVLQGSIGGQNQGIIRKIMVF